jgi:hypothetical protein
MLSLSSPSVLSGNSVIFSPSELLAAAPCCDSDTGDITVSSGVLSSVIRPPTAPRPRHHPRRRCSSPRGRTHHPFRRARRANGESSRGVVRCARWCDTRRVGCRRGMGTMPIAAEMARLRIMRRVNALGSLHERPQSQEIDRLLNAVRGIVTSISPLCPFCPFVLTCLFTFSS